MTAMQLAIVNTGLVSSIGLSAPAACAAIRAGVTNPTETRFVDSEGKWIMAHEVPLEAAWDGRAKLLRMATRAIEECLSDIPRDDWADIPLILCVAERGRPGRTVGLDDELFAEIQQELHVDFAPSSLIVPQGRVGVGSALLRARELIARAPDCRVLIAATDSLLSWPTLRALVSGERLLTPNNSNGFMPGEGAGAVLVRAAEPHDQLICLGIGQALEPSHITSGEPLRGDGLAHAIKAALGEAQLQMHDVDFRITDISGEQYYFKEAALALSRVLRVRKPGLDIWHPAECIGEGGAFAGMAMLAVARASLHKNYARGPTVLLHAANDAGERAAMILAFRRH
jgi:3-oxoacyl-[acyl-carrier-protein] synthase-1